MMKSPFLYLCILSLLLSKNTTESLQPTAKSPHEHKQRASRLQAAEDPTSNSVFSRRTVNNSLLSVATSFLVLPPQISQAEDETKQTEVSVEPRTVLRGTVSLAPGVPFPPESMPTTSSSAIYLTCRPDKPDNVPAAILNGSRGKSPPVLAARIENPSFPLDFTLVSPRDLTIEGASTAIVGDGKATDFENLWWIKEDLIVSARWDSDGVAATRSPEDLVGRAIWKNGEANVQLELGGRGAFGKLVTGSKE